ncbi:recombinase family protein [Terrihabitans soli]
MSTDIQLKGDSLRRQMELSRRYAAQHDLQLVEDTYNDIGISAFKGANVSGGALGKFLQAVKDKRIPWGSYLLVESLDRISREKPMLALATFTEIVRNGVSIVTLADNHVYPAGETDTPQLIYSIVVMGRAHDESRMKSSRISAAWNNKRANAANRKLTAQCPAWLEMNEDRASFRVLADRADVVRRIFRESQSGIGNYSIARRLNEEKIAPFGRSKGWQTSYIAKILNNRAVLGEFQPHHFVDGARVPDGEPVENYFPPVVDEELFFTAQGARNQRRAGGGGRRGPYISNLFSGIASCDYCGGRMHFLNKGAGPKGGTYLICDNARRRLGCRPAAWRYDDFEASFLAFVEELDLGPLARDESEISSRANLDQQISSLEGRRAEEEKLREKIFDLLAGGLKTEFIAKKLQDVERRLIEIDENLRLKLAERSALQFEVSQFYEGKEEIKALVTSLKDRDSRQVYSVRAQIASRLKALVQNLTLAPDGADSPGALKTDRAARTHNRAPITLKSVDHPDWRRYFSVTFKNGGMRTIYVDAKDPMNPIHQIHVPNFGKDILARTDEPRLD